MINTSSVTPQYEKPRRRRQFKEMKLFEFDQKQEENLKLLEEVRNHSAKQFNYIMDVGNEISKHAKNEDLEALQEVANRNIDILHLLRMHIEETFEQVLQFRFDDILEYFLENGFNIKDINMTRGVNKQDFEYEYEQFNKYEQQLFTNFRNNLLLGPGIKLLLAIIILKQRQKSSSYYISQYTPTTSIPIIYNVFSPKTTIYPIISSTNEFFIEIITQIKFILKCQEGRDVKGVEIETIITREQMFHQKMMMKIKFDS